MKLFFLIGWFFVSFNAFACGGGKVCEDAHCGLSQRYHDQIVQCPFCPERFYANGRLGAHIRRHVNGIPSHQLACPFCDAIFVSHRNYVNHFYRAHAKLSTCSFCGLHYFDWKALLVHLQTVHSPSPHYLQPQSLQHPQSTQTREAPLLTFHPPLLPPLSLSEE